MKNKNDLIAALIVLFIIGLFSYSYLMASKETNSDANKFSKEYNISSDNSFVYKTDKEIINILKHGTGVIYLGFPECPWCQEYVKHLDEVARSDKVEKIYYLNILDIRKNNTKEYQEIVSILNDYLDYDEEGNKRIYVPCTVAVLDGNIVGYDATTSNDTKGYDTPSEYFENEDLQGFKDKLHNMFLETDKKVCTTDCNK